MRAGAPVRIWGRGALVPLLSTVLLAGSCARGGGGEAAAPSASREVTFESVDGLRLSGRLFGKGDVGVVLSHMLPADQSSWFDFAQTLADEGYLALTYDFRGYCPGGDAGCSAGERDISAIWQDTLGAIRFLKTQGAVQVMLVGASMGGTSSLVAATKEMPQPAAIVTLSAPVSIEGLSAGPDVLQQIGAAKLFISGAGDAPAAAAAEQLFAESPPPKRWENVPSDDHGTDLLTGNQGEVVRNLVLNYLAQYSGV